MFGHHLNPSVHSKSLAALKAFLLYGIAFRKARMLHGLEKVRSKMKSCAEKRHELARSIAEFERDKKEREYAISREGSFESDFQRLCAMDGVGKVVVRGDNSEIHIYTKTLTLIHNPGGRTGPERCFDIGQKVIVVKLIPDKNEKGVHFLDGEYKGEYEHGQARHAQSTCFGTELNPVVAAYVTNCEIVPLVHLCLTFLRYEITSPVPRKKDTESGEIIELEEPREPAPDPMYLSEIERNIQKDAFVEFMRFVAREQLRAVAEGRKIEIQKKNEEIDRHEERLEELRMKRNFIRQALQGLGADERAVEAKGNADIDDLFKMDVKELRFTGEESKKLEVDCVLRISNRDPESCTLHIAVDGSVRLSGLPKQHPLASQCVDDGLIVFPKSVLAEVSAAFAGFSIPAFFKTIRLFLEKSAEASGGNDVQP